MASASHPEESGGARNKNSNGGVGGKTSSGRAVASADGHAERLASNRSRENRRKLSFQGNRFSSSEDAQPLADIPEGIPEGIPDSNSESSADIFGQDEPNELVEAIHPSIDVHSPDVHEPDRPDEVTLTNRSLRRRSSYHPSLSKLPPLATNLEYQLTLITKMIDFQVWLRQSQLKR